MKRTDDKAVFPCPVCGRKPFMDKCRWSRIWCRGGLFSRHPVVQVYGTRVYNQNLHRTAIWKWNQLQYRQTRFIYSEERDIPGYVRD